MLFFNLKIYLTSMKRKLCAMIIAGILLGAGAVVTTGAVNEFDFSSLASVGTDFEKSGSISTNAVEIQPSYLKEQKGQQLTAEKIHLQQLIGQWGYLNNPESQGDIIANYNGRTLQGDLIKTDNPIEFRIELKQRSFTGNIYVRDLSTSNTDTINIQSVGVIPIYGTYSISNGYLTAFWSKGVCEPSLSSDHQYDGWFFGEIV